MDALAQSGDKKGGVWLKVLRASLSIPGARVDREAFLRRELSNRVSGAIVDRAVEVGPSRAGVPAATVKRIATACIARHRLGVSASSFASGLPGGWWMLASLPGDLTQFYWHVVTVAQNLAYLHGWPELLRDGDDIDDETLHFLTLFVGVMHGVAGAAKIISEISEAIGKEVAQRLPRMALTKWGMYGVAKEVAKWIGIRLTKTTIARAASKAVPIVGGLISGGLTWFAFASMSRRLQGHLEALLPHAAAECPVANIDAPNVSRERRSAAED